MKEQDCSHINNVDPQTAETQANITPQCAVELLKAGNERFVNRLAYQRNLMHEVEVTSKGQYPFAIVLGCIDSRVSNELVFDQGIGDIFSTRIAGNYVTNDILGGMEFALTTGVRLVLVLGHTSCGAVKGAVGACGTEGNDLECSHIIPMVKNICPAVDGTEREPGESDADYANRVARKNVLLNIDKVRKDSACLNKAEQEGKIIIMGGMYNVSTGKVDFIEHPAS